MTKSLSAAAKDIAKKGRYGDDRLLHVSQVEIDGLASLVPGGKLPVNPDTGLPEAFFFLPFLAGLGAMAAPAAAATAAIPAAAGAIGTGLAAGAGTAAAGLGAAAAPALTGAMGAAGAGLGALGPLASSTALGGGAGLAGTAGAALAPIAETAAATALPTAGASALPAIAEVASPLTAGTSTMAGSGLGALSSVPSITPELGIVAPLAPTNPIAATAQPLVGDLAAGIGPEPLAQGLAGQSFFPPSMSTMGGGLPATTSAVPTSTASVFPAAPGEGGLGGGIATDVGAEMAGSGGAMAEGAGETSLGTKMFDGLKSGLDGLLSNPQKMMQMAGMMSMLKGSGGGKKKKSEKKDISGIKYEGGTPARPSENYRPGIDPEFRYFPFQSGGLVRGYAEGGMLTQFKPMAASSGIAALPNYSSPAAVAAPTMQMPSNGIAAIQPPSHMALFGTDAASTEPHYKDVADVFMGFMDGTKRDINWRGSRASGGLIQNYAEGGIASLLPPEQEAAPVDSPKPQSGEDDAALIEAAVKAVSGQIPEPQAGTIIQMFVDTFGEQALQDLMMKVQGMGARQAPTGQPAPSGMPSMGDGMSDSIPATISGQAGTQPAALSEGEFVVPADVVSGLGNGSTDAGAQQLHGMMDKVRTMRNGGAVQPPAIDPRMAMPI